MHDTNGRQADGDVNPSDGGLGGVPLLGELVSLTDWRREHVGGGDWKAASKRADDEESAEEDWGGKAHGDMHSGLVSVYERDSITVTVYRFMDEYRLTLQLVFVAVGMVVLWYTANYCAWCVMGLLLVSVFFCLEYRMMNLVLWSCILVLWFHGWKLGNSEQGLSLSWK